MTSASELKGTGSAVRLSFSACYVYSPRGGSAASCCSQRLRARLKAVDATWFPRYAARVREQVLECGRFPGVFGPEVTLVPVPRSGTSSIDATWVAARLAAALQDAGLAGTVWHGLKREYAVRKSATARGGERPTVKEHYESLTVEAATLPLVRVLLVDDVVTKGRTLLAAAMRLREALPSAELRAFALVRTLGLVPEVVRLLDPCQGVICWSGEDARRVP